VVRFIGDVLFFMPTREALLGMASNGREAWQYGFTRINGVGAKGSGAFHGAEIPYVFGTMDVAPLGFGPAEPGTYDEADLKLSDLIQRNWVQFARTGNPNWPAYGRARTYLQLDSTQQTGHDLRREELDVLSRIVP
jgi:para-nitrobenzyl esterase